MRAEAYTIEEVEAALAARVAALDATPFRQGDELAVWRESEIPMTAVQDSALEQHLAFSVSHEDVQVVDDGHAPDGLLTCLSTVALVFMFRCRARTQLADMRVAQKAARHVCLALQQPSPYFTVRPVTLYRPAALQNNFLPVEQVYLVGFDSPLSETP